MSQITGFIWIVAAIALAAGAVQALWMVVDAVRRSAHDSARQVRTARLLDQRIAAVRDQQKADLEKGDMWSGWRKFEVAKKAPEPGQICSFYLEPHDGKKPLPAFMPGQYLTFQLPVPNQPKPIVRCYSLSDGVTDGHYRVSIKRVAPPRDKPDAPPGKGSNYFHDHVNEGDIIDVKAPSGHFFLDLEDDSPIVLIGGGIGVTPVLSMLNTLASKGTITREVHFFLGVRNGKDHPFKEHLEQMDAQHDKLHIHVCYSGPADDEVEGRDYRHKGRVSVELFKKVLPSSNYKFYLCGPPPMMESVVGDLEAWGVPEKDINFEAFGPASVKKVSRKMEHLSPEKEEKAASESGGVEVVFARSNKTHNWQASAGTILEFAEANDIHMESGCRAGNCGTCSVAIKEGEVKYETDVGSDVEAGSCLTCCCIPKTKLVLDA